MASDRDELDRAFLALEAVQAEWERARRSASEGRRPHDLEQLADRMEAVAEQFAAVSARFFSGRWLAAPERLPLNVASPGFPPHGLPAADRKSRLPPGAPDPRGS